MPLNGGYGAVDRFVFEGFDPVQPNVHVAVNIDADRFLNLFVARVSGK